MAVKLNLDSIREGAQQLDSATEAVQGLFDQFKSSVDGLADSFGGDMIGSLLDLAHQAVMEAITECITTNIEDLGDYAENLRQIADTHEENDAEIERLFRAILAELGRG
ncbi:WXG100 family type VII secretion target [Glycomyces artemisiae]|uniref:Uncharacterized protein YukE n=1 Tax=Glycomyces artemisiae TaxID=1076443 RepID=A0A2T0USD0_9ACTN|nr:hypothetical protein [Glycomyces artemisiae]PRY60813.1 uncharacterized protein YukE [Glycomyces artemisiae]